MLNLVPKGVQKMMTIFLIEDFFPFATSVNDTGGVNDNGGVNDTGGVNNTDGAP
jgi:hypothetical protein